MTTDEEYVHFYYSGTPILIQATVCDVWSKLAMKTKQNHLFIYMLIYHFTAIYRVINTTHSMSLCILKHSHFIKVIHTEVYPSKSGKSFYSHIPMLIVVGGVKGECRKRISLYSHSTLHIVANTHVNVLQ